jgi:hypothetical protein
MSTPSPRSMTDNQTLEGVVVVRGVADGFARQDGPLLAVRHHPLYR